MQIPRQPIYCQNPLLTDSIHTTCSYSFATEYLRTQQNIGKLKTVITPAHVFI